MDPQLFMNQNGLTQCYEVDGQLFKRKENAAIREQETGKQMQEHTINAGVRKGKKNAEASAGDQPINQE